MAYLDSSRDRVIYYAKIHWVLYLSCIIWLLIGILLLAGGGDDESRARGAFCFFIAILLFIPKYIYAISTELALTETTIAVKVGFIKRQTIELRLNKVESIQVHQSILGRILDYGTISVTGAGITNTPIYNIAQPLRFKQQVESILKEKGL